MCDKLLKSGTLDFYIILIILHAAAGSHTKADSQRSFLQNT